jgi:methylmalonyl-CoA mutase N-terminal domain/subunit
MVNVVRTAIQALAAVLGGTQSLHTNAMDEAIALPSEEAVLLALRTQQIIAYESGATDTADPLGGSYVVERLTSDLEQDCSDYFRRIEDFGGVLPALEAGFFQKEIAEASFRYQQEVERRERIVVGVNEYVTDEAANMPVLEMEADGERRHADRLRQVRAERDGQQASACLRRLEEACNGRENLMPYLLEAVEAYCTLGEICAAMRRAFGEYQPSTYV